MENRQEHEKEAIGRLEQIAAQLQCSRHDRFAAAALTGVLSSGWVREGDSESDIASWAWQLADEMVKPR